MCSTKLWLPGRAVSRTQWHSRRCHYHRKRLAESNSADDQLGQKSGRLDVSYAQCSFHHIQPSTTGGANFKNPLCHSLSGYAKPSCCEVTDDRTGPCCCYNRTRSKRLQTKNCAILGSRQLFWVFHYADTQYGFMENKEMFSLGDRTGLDISKGSLWSKALASNDRFQAEDDRGYL